MTADPVRQEGDARLSVRLATCAADIEAVQRLRYRVFVQEMGADGPLVDHRNGLEQDAFDPYFDHLLLIDESADRGQGHHVAGAYRLLPGCRIGQGVSQFYCDDEFDLTPLRASGRRLLELGRSCVDPAYRGGLAMLAMWQGLADYVERHRIELLFGAASFPGTEPARWAHALSWLHHHHLAPQELRVHARCKSGFSPVAIDTLDRKTALTNIPPLIRGYLRLGGVVGEGIFIDQAFGTTDVCVILDTRHLTEQARALSRQAQGRNPLG